MTHKSNILYNYTGKTNVFCQSWVKVGLTVVLLLFAVSAAKGQTATQTSDSVTAHKSTVLAFRSNLLLPLLNVGAELPLDNRWSLGVDYYYPWIWPNSNNKNCFEVIYLSGEARYWFGKKHSSGKANRQYRLTGHSVGVYGAWGYYDLEHNYKGHQGNGWSAGVDYLYSKPIAKGKMHLEFQLAAGFVSTKAKPYHVYEHGGTLYPDRKPVKKVSYFGPTKVAVSLVIPINRIVKP